MGRNRIRQESDARNVMINNGLDDRDQQILSLLLSGKSNRAIAIELKIPMSTVQRRTRKLFEGDVVRARYELNHKKFGLRKGMIHVYLKDGDIQGIANQVSKIPGMQSTTIHIGNSDIVGLFVFKETQRLLDIMSECKKIVGIDRVVWSEEVADIAEADTGDNDRQLLSEIA
jgi:DNA-binding Lrp family transcriptional regulator